MGVHIDSDEFERLARELADRRGTSVDQVLLDLVRRELAREGAISSEEPSNAEGSTRLDAAEIAQRRAVVRDVQARMASAPVLDPRPYREALYDEDGLPR